MAWRGLRSDNGKPFASISRRKCHPEVDARASTIGAVVRVSSGSCGRAPNGANCPGDMAVPAPAGGGSRPGKRPGCSSSSSGPSWPSSMTSRRSVGTNASPMVALSRRKKGPQGRHDQARQGHEVDGGGRWRGYSVGSIRGGGFPGGGHPPRTDARYHRSRPAGHAGPAPQATRAFDCGSGV
jgi:hypothetical protein